MTIRAPWTTEQIAALNRYQKSARHHPFTCAFRDDHPVIDGEKGVLVARPEGWVCQHCGYTQGWAHAAMLSEGLRLLRADQGAEADGS